MFEKWFSPINTCLLSPRFFCKGEFAKWVGRVEICKFREVHQTTKNKVTDKRTDKRIDNRIDITEKYNRLKIKKQTLANQYWESQ